MSGNSDFVIKYRILEQYNGPGGDVVIPEQVTEIRGWAFNGCSSLKNVYIHGGGGKIHKTAFLECPHLNFHAPAGSYAEQYARENGIPFQLTEEQHPSIKQE